MCVHKCVLSNAPGCCQLSLVGITAPYVYLLGRDDMHLHWRPSQQRQDDSFVPACHSLKYKCILQLWEESVHITDPHRWGCTGEYFPNRRGKCWHTKRGVVISWTTLQPGPLYEVILSCVGSVRDSKPNTFHFLTHSKVEATRRSCIFSPKMS